MSANTIRWFIPLSFSSCSWRQHALWSLGRQSELSMIVSFRTDFRWAGSAVRGRHLVICLQLCHENDGVAIGYHERSHLEPTERMKLRSRTGPRPLLPAADGAICSSKPLRGRVGWSRGIMLTLSRIGKRNGRFSLAARARTPKESYLRSVRQLVDLAAKIRRRSRNRRRWTTCCSAATTAAGNRRPCGFEP